MEGNADKGPPIKKFRIKLVSIKNKGGSNDNIPVSASSVESEIKNVQSVQTVSDSVIKTSNVSVSSDLKLTKDNVYQFTLSKGPTLPDVSDSINTSTEIKQRIDYNDGKPEELGFDGIYFLSKHQGDSASDMGSNASLAGKSVVSSTLPPSNPVGTSAGTGKFKLKIKKMTPTPTTNLKSIIDESYHYELPVGDVCITSGVYFDKHFFDVIYPGKTLSSELGVCNKNTKSHLQMDKTFHKYRMSMLPSKRLVNTDKSVDKNSIQKISFTIAKQTIPPDKLSDNSRIRHLFVSKSDKLKNNTNRAVFSTSIGINKSDDISSSRDDDDLLSIKDFPPLSGTDTVKSFVSRVSVTIPTSLTQCQSYNMRAITARKLIRLGYNLVSESGLFPGAKSVQSVPKFKTCILKSQFVGVGGKDLFYSVDSNISTEIALDAPFSLKGVFRFITTTIKIVNLSPVSSDINLELSMDNKEVVVTDPINYKYGVKKVQLIDELKFLPPCNYAGLLFESFHRALIMKRNRDLPHYSVQISQFLEIAWKYMKSNRVSLLDEIDSLLSVSFEVTDIPHYKLVIFTPKMVKTKN